MSTTLNAKDVFTLLNLIADTIEASQDYLSELDGALGDGDHGVSMTIGWRAVREKLATMPDADIATLLKTTGMTIVSAVGAAMGPLYGTGFMRAGVAAGSKTVVDEKDMVAMFEAFREGIMSRGKANVGDKTMVDTIYPAVEAFKASIKAGDDLFTALDKTMAAAEAGMKSTIDLISKIGRSSRLGERTIGHQDAGATSSYFMIKAAAEGIKKLKQTSHK